MLNSIKLLGVTITNETEKKVLEYVLERVRGGGKKFFVATPNPEFLVYAQAHPSFREILNKAEVALPDGIGIMMGAQLLGKPVKNRITGTDFIEILCKETKEKPVSMGFLGGRRGVAEKAAHCLVSKYPWLNVVFIADEWSEDGFKNVSSSKEKSNYIHNTKYLLHNTKEIDILFVAFGFPKQEEWIVENLDKLPVKMAMGVGGAFDYISGEVTRAPKFIRAIGLEWLFRLIRQPWRLKRQLALLKFSYLILKEKTK